MLSTQLNEQRGQNHFYVIDAFSRILDSKVLKVIVNIISCRQNCLIFYQNIIITLRKYKCTYCIISHMWLCIISYLNIDSIMEHFTLFNISCYYYPWYRTKSMLLAWNMLSVPMAILSLDMYSTSHIPWSHFPNNGSIHHK